MNIFRERVYLSISLNSVNARSLTLLARFLSSVVLSFRLARPKLARAFLQTMILILKSPLFSFTMLYKAPPHGGPSKLLPSSTSCFRIQGGQLFHISCRFVSLYRRCFFVHFHSLAQIPFRFHALKFRRPKYHS